MRVAKAFGSELVGCHVYAAKMHDYRFKQMEYSLPEEYLEENELERQRKIHDSLITLGLELISDSYLESMKQRCASEDLPFEGRMMDGKHHVEICRDLAASDCDLVVLGLLAGTLSGLIGCGGGVLKVSLLIIMFGFEIFLAKVVSLVSCGFMSLSSSYRYVKQGRVDAPALNYLIPSSILGVLIGIGVSMLLDRHVLEFILGLFLVYAALDVAYQIHADRRDQKMDPGNQHADSAAPDRSVLVWAGLPMGVFSAMLGITGGVIGTPLQRSLLKAPMKTCIANTLVTVVFVSFLGGALLLIEGLIRDYFSFQTFVMVLLAVMPGSVVGGQLGARLNEELPVNYIKGIYAAVVLFISYKILISV